MNIGHMSPPGTAVNYLVGVIDANGSIDFATSELSDDAWHTAIWGVVLRRWRYSLKMRAFLAGSCELSPDERERILRYAEEYRSKQ